MLQETFSTYCHRTLEPGDKPWQQKSNRLLSLKCELYILLIGVHSVNACLYFKGQLHQVVCLLNYLCLMKGQGCTLIKHIISFAGCDASKCVL